MPVTVSQQGPMPDAPEPLWVSAPERWAAERLDQLCAHASAGGVVVVTAPPATPGWADLLGVEVNPPLTRAEVVAEPTVHVAARNLHDAVLHGDVTPLTPREGTTAVLTTSVHLTPAAVVTVRPVGRGAVVGVGCNPEDTAGAEPIRTAVGRLCRRVTTPTTAIGMGIVGYGQHGGMGWYHGTATAAVEGMQLAAIAESHDGRRADAGRRFPDAALHDSVEGLLADNDVDVVVIATPPSAHHEMTRRVLRAGKHAVVEKPLCFTAAEADDLLALADRTGRVLTVHQNRRWDPDFRAISRAVADGLLGEVFNVETFVGGFEHPCRLWHSDTAVSGGRLYDWGAHLIDQTLQLYGTRTPVAVWATGHKRKWHDVTNLDQVRVRLRFDNGAEAEFLDSDVLAVRRPKYLLQGTEGTLVGSYRPLVEERVTPEAGYERTEHHHAEGPADLRLVTHRHGWGLAETALPGLPAAPFPFHRRLADHLQLGDAVPVDPAEARTVTAVLEAAHASVHDGGTVRIPS